MKRYKKILFFVAVIILTLACTTINFSTPVIVDIPTNTQSVPTLPPTQIIVLPIDTSFPQATPLPEWVTEFADPILFEIKESNPTFQDNFSTYRGWINVTSDSIGYTYAERFEEKLWLKLPNDVKESVFYNPRFLNHKNFVLTLELRFHQNQPEDTIRFQFDGFQNEHVAFDLTNNRNWTFHWKSENTLRNISGVYPHFQPEYIPVTIIMDGTECAVYLNNDPLVYVDDCRELSTDKKFDNWLTSFRVLRNGNHSVLLNIDNLKLWDLDRIRELR